MKTLARLFTVLSFTVAIVQLWALSVQAADTTRTTRKLPDGRTETCTYEKSFGQTADGSLVIRTAWRCETPARAPKAR